MSRRFRVCYAGTYEREYPRNHLVIRALRDAGVRVEEAQVPVFELVRDKSVLSAGALAILGVKLALAYLRLLPEVALRLLRCDALAIGYIGQLDMLILGPLARLMNRPVLFNPLVTLTDTVVEDRRRVRPGGLASRTIALIDRLALRLADVVLVDTVENGEYLQQRFSVPESRIVVVAVGADESTFAPGETSRSTDLLDVLFYGKFIPLHGIETVVQAAAILERHNFPGRIELVGSGQEYHRIRELADNLNVANIVWTDWIPFQRLGERLRQADIVLGIFDDGPKAARVIPNKIYQALACGKPVVTRRGAAIERLLTDDDTAVLVPPADPAALAAAIERLADQQRRDRIARGGRDAWNTNASRRALARQVRPALDRLGLTP